MRSRISPHVIETNATNYVTSVICSYYENGDALFRKLTERDYGIDGIIELFNDGDPTGQMALVQIKGTDKTIEKLKMKDVVSCPVSISNIKYAQQKNIPVILMYVSLKEPKIIYFIDINDEVKNLCKKKIKEQNNITIHIPVENNTNTNLDQLFKIIKGFFDKGE